MLYYIPSLTITVVLFVLMIFAFLAGVWIKQKKIKRHLIAPDEGLGAVEGSLLGLLALLLAFTFGMANTRHDNRHGIMIDEGNGIATAILRTDLFPDSVRKELRSQLKGYLKSRVELYNAGIDAGKKKAAFLHSWQFEDSLWKKAANLARSENVIERSNGSLMVVALNNLFEAAASRKASLEATIPESILWLLLLLCLFSAFIGGYGAKRTIDWVMVIGFALMISVTVLAILDLDRPYRGFIRLEKAEKMIVELQKLL